MSITGRRHGSSVRTTRVHFTDVQNDTRFTVRVYGPCSRAVWTGARETRPVNTGIVRADPYALYPRVLHRIYRAQARWQGGRSPTLQAGQHERLPLLT